MKLSHFHSGLVKTLLIGIVLWGQMSFADIYNDACDDGAMPSLRDMINGCVSPLAPGLAPLGSQLLTDICVCTLRLYWNTITTTCAVEWSYAWGQDVCVKYCKDFAAEQYAAFESGVFREGAFLDRYQKCESDI